MVLPLDCDQSAAVPCLHKHPIPGKAWINFYQTVDRGGLCLGAISYRTFDGVGGDCTNFVSQIMRAGGWQDVPGYYSTDSAWWYQSLGIQSYPWINVSYFYTFAAVRSQRTRILAGPSSMLPGDVLQADFDNNGGKDHTMIVSYHSGTQPYLTYHSVDTYRRSLSSLLTAYPHARWIPHRT